MENQLPLVSIIIPTRNRAEKLRRCLKSVSESEYSPIEILVVDDASDDDVASSIKDQFPQVHVYRNNSRRLLSYSRNLGAMHSKGQYLFFLDDDNTVSPNTISELMKPFLEGNRIGVVSPIAYRYDNRTVVWTSYIRKDRFPGFYVLGSVEPTHLIDTFSFHNAFIIKRSIFEECDRFDYETFPIHFSEVDFTYRLHRLGYKAVVNPKAKVWHDVGSAHMHIDSFRSFFTLRNRIILLRRYESRNVLRYIIAILPLLTLYYFVHHMLNATDNRVLASYNLLKGVIAGLTFHDRRRVVLQNLYKKIQPTIKPELKSISDDFPLVSVVIPTKNSAKTICQCLESLQRQSYPNIEILVIDGYSADDTISLAKSFKGVKVFVTGHERSAQMNFGVKMSRGAYIYRVDSDFIVEPKVIEEAINICRHGYQVVTIHNTSDPTISFWSKVRKLERDCYEDDTLHIAARFIDKDVFLRAGGFNEKLIASEDYDLHNKLVHLGFKIGRIKAREVHIGEPRTLKDIVLKHIYYGKKIKEFIKQNPGLSLTQLSPLRISYVRHRKSFLRNPKLTLGFFLYQYVRYLSAIAGYLTTTT